MNECTFRAGLPQEKAWFEAVRKDHSIFNKPFEDFGFVDASGKTSALKPPGRRFKKACTAMKRRRCSNNCLCPVSDFKDAEAKTCNTHLQEKRRKRAAATKARQAERAGPRKQRAADMARLKALMPRLGVSQVEVARTCGVSSTAQTKRTPMLSADEIAVMDALSNSEQTHGSSSMWQKELVESCGFTDSKASRVLSRMERAGLLRRVRDGMSKRVEIAERGEALSDWYGSRNTHMPSVVKAGVAAMAWHAANESCPTPTPASCQPKVPGSTYPHRRREALLNEATSLRPACLRCCPPPPHRAPRLPGTSGGLCRS